MSQDYRKMWESLGLNLPTHDALLAVLGKGYKDIFMTQENRPKAMEYFDFVISQVHGLRVKELMDEKAAGRKVIGSCCVFVPEEIVRAADATLVGLCTGADFATEEVEKLLPRNTCALIKSAFGFKLGKVCPYIESADMIVGENTCDGKKKSYETLGGLVKMLYVGIDIGSRTIELVAVKDREIVEARQADSGFDPLAQAKSLIEGVKYDGIMATGYGRHLLELALDAPTVTEIKAYAVGALFLVPEVRTILDIGGQDSKAISLNESGRVSKFEMNDRCAAGTGKFLEVMARALGFPIEELGTQALKARKDIQISSMCTVFAESEVTSLLAKGEDRLDIALGLHRSVVRRAAGMLKRVSEQGPMVFAGGVAKNACMHRLLEEALQSDIIVPKSPQMVGALGAALLSGDGK